jgi:Mrp family chromosome partitioning ATPase
MNAPVNIKLRALDEMEASLSAQLQPLCSRVESEIGKPAVILVTSAVDGDGKSMTAHSLASCFVHFGHRAALVSLRPEGAVERGVTALALPLQDGQPIGQDRLATFVEELRSDHDFTIVDVGTFLSSGSAMVLARLVDGILLVVRAGRAPADEDKLMLRTIEHCGNRIIGVVMTSEAAVFDFERRHTGDRPDSGGGSAKAANVCQRVWRIAGNLLGNPIECSIPDCTGPIADRRLRTTDASNF